ncbi:MAG: ATP-binding protein [Firmicutes bacterium HGW-Firmicutes-21]|nr:MAG: ATP-binding protein [Firmicutes bacterium HGW-Firmicutes-21]
MKELSLNILDIVMNSVKAGAKIIAIRITEDNRTLAITIEDNGCGMTAEQLERLSDPFFTTRTTRQVGLGVPFFRLAAEQTGGGINITSVPISEDEVKHGTVVTALFYKDHIDYTPLGDIIATVITLIQGNADINFDFSHTINGYAINLSTAEMRSELGEDIPLNSFEVLEWIKEYLNEQYNGI